MKRRNFLKWIVTGLGVVSIPTLAKEKISETVQSLPSNIKEITLPETYYYNPKIKYISSEDVISFEHEVGPHPRYEIDYVLKLHISCVYEDFIEYDEVRVMVKDFTYLRGTPTQYTYNCQTGEILLKLRG